MKPEDLYHAGIVVEEFEATLQCFAEVAGYRWCDEMAVEQAVSTPEGERTVPIRFTYSMDEPRVEILQAVPGTVWAPSTPGVHHLGYWSDDVTGDLDVLTRNGVEVEVMAPLPDGSVLWAYCRGPVGTRIELVDRSIEPTMAEWFATGRRPFG
jgi:hypothetical protein